MWRVSKNGHDLWILATLEPLPKNMTWRSLVVEKRIASSQVVLSSPDDLGSYDEHKRPILAASDVFDGALNQSGLTSNGMMRRLAVSQRPLNDWRSICSPCVSAPISGR
jgi:hypothetical protein